jgi:hypothetical protein
MLPSHTMSVRLRRINYYATLCGTWSSHLLLLADHTISECDLGIWVRLHLGFRNMASDCGSFRAA